jgi:hypothetical protein
MTTTTDRRLARIEQLIGRRSCDCPGYVVVPPGAAPWGERQAAALAARSICGRSGHRDLFLSVPGKETARG